MQTIYIKSKQYTSKAPTTDLTTLRELGIQTIITHITQNDN